MKKKYCIKVRNTLGLRSPIVRATMVLTEKIDQHVADLVELWRDTVDLITTQDLTWRTKLHDKGEWVNRESSALPTNFAEIIEEAIHKKIKFICPYLYQSIYQFHGDDLIPCGDHNAQTHMVMGDWRTQSIHDIWTGKEYNDLRALHRKGKWLEHPICRDCEVAIIELHRDMNS